jgi:phage terminase large subunit-like protein
MWGTPRNYERKTLGGKAARIMEAMGCSPMPWQRYILDVALEIDPGTGLLAYRKIGLSVPRQQGKTELVFTIMIHRIMAWSQQNVVYACQTRTDARKRWEDELLARMETSPLDGKFHPRKSNGNEAIIWKTTRSRIGITANTEKAGHGPPLDLGMIDEAFAHVDDRLEQAMSPAMTTRKNAQMWWVSAGGTTKSVFLNSKRQMGREMIERNWANSDWSGAVAYFEWYAPEDLPRDDPSTWASCMPALGITVQPETIKAELLSMDEPEFDRAYLNRTRKPTPPDDVNVPKKEWVTCVDKESKATETLAFGIDVAPLRDYSSISVASMQIDGKVHVELVDRRPGTDWLVAAIVKLKERWNPVAIALDAKGPAGSLLDELAVNGIKAPAIGSEPLHGDLAIPRAYEVAAACGQMSDAIRQGTIRHIDQALLTGAINGASTRPLGEAWAWNRRSSMVDISPLVAATFARWALIVRESAIEPDYNVLDSLI